MAIIPRRDWETVKEQVGKVVRQVEDLACLYQQQQIRDQIDALIKENESRFLNFTGPLRLIIEKNPDLSRLLYHDLLGYFSLISLLFQRLKTDPEATIHSMHRRARVMSHVVTALAFYVEGEELLPEPTQLMQWIKSFKNFFDETFKSYDPKTKQQSPLVRFDLPERSKVSVQINHSLVLLLIINILQNAVEHGKAKLVVLSACETSDEVALEISDDGTGIYDDVHRKIFRSDISTNNSFGLGLSKAREKMATMGGRIDCIPRGGIRGGAKFVLFFKKG